MIWHAGLSGSIPLQIGGTGSEVLGVVYQAPVTATIFHPMNLVMVLVILVLMPFVNYAMHPDTDHTIAVDPALLVDEAEKTYTMNTPAEKIEHNKVLWFITLVLGFAYIVYYFVQKGFNLDLNIVNMIFCSWVFCSTVICAGMWMPSPMPPPERQAFCSSSPSMPASWD